MQEQSGTDEEPEQIEQMLAELSRQLEEGHWPASAERLRLLLLQPDSDSAADETSLVGLEAEEQDAMLTLAVNDALEGVDISLHYPDFYQKMLADNELRQAFLESLELLTHSRAGTLLPLPFPASQSLTFLQANPVVPGSSRIEQTGPGRWRILWRRTLAEIQAILFDSSPLTNSPAFRGPTPLPTGLEDPWFTLLRSEVEVEAYRLSVLLQATQLADRPSALELFLIVGVLPLANGTEAAPPLRANLRWGNYGQSALLDTTGQATFSAVPFNTILTPDHKAVKDHLYFSLEPVTT